MAQHRAKLTLVSKRDPGPRLLDTPRKKPKYQPPSEPYNIVVKRKFAEEGFKKREIRDNGRPISFEEACRRHVMRFTKDHIPAWADKPITQDDGSIAYPGPHYESDQEWYANTEFMGEGTLAVRKYCRNLNQSYPCGKWLPIPYREWAKRQTLARERLMNKVSLPKKAAAKKKTATTKRTKR